VRPEADLAAATLVEVVPDGWVVTDAADGIVDVAAGTVTWDLADVAEGTHVARHIVVRAPSIPVPGGSLARVSTFSAYLDQDGVISSAPDLNVLVAPAVEVGHSTLGQIDKLTFQPTYRAQDAPITNEQRFEVFRVRFEVTNPDTVAMTWTPRLEFTAVPDDLTSWAAVAPGEAIPGVPFYVSPEWRPTSDGGSVLGPDDEALVVTSADEKNGTSYAPATGDHSMGANPIPVFGLPPLSVSDVEFSVRATVDAAYLVTYQFRVTDRGTAFAGAAGASVTMGAEPPPDLSPVQYAGIPASASSPGSAGSVPSTSPASPSPTGLRFALTLSFASFTVPAAPVTLPLLDAPTFASPHGPYPLTTDACAACHSSHAAQARNLLSRSQTQSDLCFTCHNGSGAEANVQAAFTNPSVPADDPTNSSYYRHSALAPALLLDRYSECADCHNPHRANSADASGGTTGYTLSGRLEGTSGVVLANSATPGAAPTYTWKIAAGGDSIGLEYQLCLKCHSGFTKLPNQPADFPGNPSYWELDKGIELNPNNASYHPVEAAGTNATPAMANSLLGTSPYKLWTFSTGDTVRCVNCHGDPAKATPASPPGAGSDLAAHASPYRGLLMQNYRDRVLKGRTEPYTAADFALCYQCHAEAPFTDKTGNVRTDTNFRFHGLHVANLQGAGDGGTDIDTAGAGQGDAVCAECHFRIHSTALAVKADESTNTRLVNFAPNVGADVGAWTSTGVGSGTCTLSCHGQPHTYAYGTTPSRLTLTVTASPTTYSLVGDLIHYSYVIKNTGTSLLAGPFGVTDDRVATVTCIPVATLAVGATDTCTGSMTVGAANLTAGAIISTASAHNALYVSNTVHTTVTPPLTLSASASRPTYPGPGTLITTTYTIWNMGSTTLAGPFAVDASRSGSIVSCGGAASLAPGASTSCTGSYATTQADTDAGSATDDAIATNGTLTSGTVSTTVVTSLTLLTVATEASYAAEGDTIHYTYLLTNDSWTTLTGPPTWANVLGTVDCTGITGLAPGSSAICTGAYTVTDDDIAAGQVSNAPSFSIGTAQSNISAAVVPRVP
jgi:predicted CXXCH cytochrome family protein